MKKQSTTDKQQARMQVQIDELTADLKRERADFLNFRRRAEIGQSQIMDVAKTQVVTQLLPVLDDLERALGHLPRHLAEDVWAMGVGQVQRQIEQKFSELGIERIEALGQVFDPRQHEAVGFEDVGSGQEVVIEELRAGYKMAEQVIRPSMVRVGKHPQGGKP